MTAILMMMQDSMAAVTVKDVPAVIRTDINLTGEDAKNLIKIFNLNRTEPLQFNSGSNGLRHYMEIDAKYLNRLRLSGGEGLTWYWIDCQEIASQNPTCEVDIQYAVEINSGYVSKINKIVFVSFSEYYFPGSWQNFRDSINLQLESSMNPSYIANLDTGGLNINFYCTNETNRSCGLKIRLP